MDAEHVREVHLEEVEGKYEVYSSCVCYFDGMALVCFLLSFSSIEGWILSQ
jgi:hypothetical protein